MAVTLTDDEFQQLLDHFTLATSAFTNDEAEQLVANEGDLMEMLTEIKHRAASPGSDAGTTAPPG